MYTCYYTKFGIFVTENGGRSTYVRMYFIITTSSTSGTYAPPILFKVESTCMYVRKFFCYTQFNFRKEL